MVFAAELNFLEKMLTQFHLNMHIINSQNPLDEKIDLGLRKLLGIEDDYDKSFCSFLYRAQGNILYRISDDFFCDYIVMMLPEAKTSEKTFLVAGPFTEQDFSKQDIYRAIEKYRLSPALTERVLQYYSSVTLISDVALLSAIFTAFADVIWNGSSNYTTKHIVHSLSKKYIDNIPDTMNDIIPSQKEIAYKIDFLEKKYAAENQFLLDISQGNYQKAEVAFESSTLFNMETLLCDPIANLKTYCISLNTLLCKAAEKGNVHPVHIDKLSAEFIKKIDAIISLEAGRKLMRDMIKQYGQLVKNYSLKEYSPLIQKVITRIEADLTADQTLNTHAQLLKVSPSYLSTLFRKEMGITLTEFTNRKRVEYGVFLLNTTTMQVQVIAQHCGIYDINYFTRIFKKYIGKTPKEYRNSIGS